MTDIQENTLPVAGQSGPDAAATSGTSGAGSTRPAAKGLSSKLLPELQQIASSLGISTTKKKKSDLVAAIAAARAGSGSSPAPATARAGSAPVETAPARAATARSAPVESAPAQSAPVESGSTEAAPPRRERPRRERAPRTDSAEPAAVTESPVAERPAGPGATTDAAGEGATNVQSRTERQRAQRNEQRSNGERPATEQRSNGERPATDQRTNGEQRAAADGQHKAGQGAPRNGEPRNNDQRNGEPRNNDQRNNDQRNGDQRNGDQRNGEPRNNDQRNGEPRNGDQRTDDDEFDRGGRRGRRYRDRRGRTRDRVPGAAGAPTANTDVEPTVTEDDVLVPVGGILDCVEDKNNWFIRVEGYFSSPEDVFVANSFVRRYNLRRGDAVTGAVRQPRDGERKEKFNPLVRLDSLNGKEPEQNARRLEFTKLTPLYPQQRLRLETEPHILTTRVIDLVMPIGKGQRALIVSPPKAGKTMVLQAIANAIVTNNPEAHLMVVLIDERPEEVTDMQRSVKGEVIASTFDRRPQDHIAVAELSIERAKRLVEMGHDVVVLLDSITRLGRAYNLGAPASGRILSGGVDSTALYQPKRFLGAARNIENGGSLTIIATALVETGSAGDTVFFEEYKGTGNAELKLDRKIADKRIFPAIDVDQSSTRKEEILLSPDELAVTIKLRRVLHSLDQQQAIELLLDRLRKSRTNIEFLMQIAKTAPGSEPDRSER